jgi:hypothetical protein
MSLKNNTKFDIDWLRRKGFIGNCDIGDEVDPACPEKSERFRYRETMDFDGYKEIKISITLDLVIPSSSRVYYNYIDHGYLKTKEYSGAISSKDELVALLNVMCPELAVNFATA